MIEGITKDLGGFVGFVAGFLRLARGLGATKGVEGPGNCAIWPSKWTLGLIDRFDLRSVCSAMIN